MKKQILAISAILMLIATIPAFAEESTNKVYGVGFGVAVDDSNDAHRSKMLFALKVTSNDTDTEYEVKRGLLTIRFVHERDNYLAIADTWTVSVSEDKQTFHAEGKMLDSNDEEHDVVLEGELLHDTNQGLLYIVKGTLDDEYNLYYLINIADIDKMKKR
ncbi:MAG: hypothetical protein KatS3mg003_0613 [Candidatus Nitrosocaldaceae archaeon]|nr:MAG: hypothetical protein KatS3mg003_0613 [Candidatus Nitrosocaldaceae archaeon]